MRAKLFLMLLLVAGVLPAADAPPEPEANALLSAFTYRNLGPFRAGSWITDIAAPQPTHEHPYTFYVAARNGGVWKTVNNGTTFENITDSVDISSVGDIAVAPSDPNVIWVGTGDAEVARSSYAGDGVYRSLDGGTTSEHMGLADSHHIARILIHPTDPDTVWVASMGHLFSENAERGVFKTTDGGATWTHSLDLGPAIGVIDLVARSDDPQVLFAAAYDKVRLPWHFEAGGEGSGLYRSGDGGANWERVDGGFPSGNIGRIGVDLTRDHPDRMLAIIENLNLREPTEEEAEEDREADKEPEPRPIGNQVWRSDDGGANWHLASEEGVQIGSKSAYAFNEVRMDPVNPDHAWVTSETILSTLDGGHTWRDLNWPPEAAFAKIFGDVRTLWIDPEDSNHLLLGSDGGVFPSYDGGKTADHLYNLPLGEIYGIAVDTTEPYHLYAGLQDHEAWRGPIDGWSGAVTLADWVAVGMWDGMYSQIDPENRYYYSTTQFGNHIRGDFETGLRRSIKPEAEEEEPEYRFTWVTPLQLSPHDPQVVFTGAQMVLRSPDRGETWEEISPDLTFNDAEKIAGEGYINYCTITSLAQSALDADMIWAGTDDGRVWSTSNGGASWDERTTALAEAGGPADRWVSRVTPSSHFAQRAYVSQSGYRRDDPRPFLFRTDDGGGTWRAITHGLPQAAISVIAEDPANPDLLFVGNDIGVFVSFDAGASWQAMRNNMPRVPVRDLLVHPTEHDLVVGTYGRGLWVTDIYPLQQLNRVSLSEPAHLFEIEPRPVQLTQRSEWGNYSLYGDRHLDVPNRADGLEIYYHLARASEKPVEIRIERPSGRLLATLEGPSSAGIHRVPWRTRYAESDPEEEEGTKDETEEAEGVESRRRTRLEEMPPMKVTQ
jgi:photosystem II stability/assembly factor-like uncharacterized protein